MANGRRREKERKGVQWGWGAWDTQAAPPECKGAFGPKSSGTVEGGGETEGRGVGEEGGSGQQGVCQGRAGQGGWRADAQRGGSSTVDAPSHPGQSSQEPPRPLRHLLRRQQQQRVVFL